MMKIFGILGGVLAAFLMPSALAVAVESEFVDAECWFPPLEFPPSDGVECGWLQVPEDRANQNSDRVIRLPVVILHGNAGRYGLHSVVLGGGGPGAGLNLHSYDDIDYWNVYRQQTLGEAGTLILMDQRGAGMSKPRLACPDSEISNEEYLSSAITPDDDFRIHYDTSKNCAQQFSDWGVNLSAYTTAASADDYEDLRRLFLGDQWWNIVGYSYGTRLAFELIRRHPDGVRTAVMGGVSPPESTHLNAAPNFSAALVKIAESCNDDDFCRTTYGDMLANLKTASHRLNATPITVGGPIVINSNRLSDMILHGMYDSTGVALLPCLAWELAGGQECLYTQDGEEKFALDWFVDNYYLAVTENFSDALLESIACREYGRNDIERKHEGFPFDLWFKWDEISESACDDIWAQDGKIAGGQDSVTTDKPILMLTGFFDPATPPEPAAAAARHLPNVRIYQFQSSHNFSRTGQMECESELTSQFLYAPGAEINDLCVRQIAPISFR